MIYKLRIKFKNHVSTLEDLLAGKFQLSHHSLYELKVISLIEHWVKGKESFLISTSGSTGKPKPIQLHRNDLIDSAERTIDFFRLDENDTGLICLDINQIAGMMMLIRALVAEMDVIIQEPNSNPFSQIENEYYPTFTALVPMQLDECLAEYEKAPEKFRNLRAVIVGGAPVSHGLALNCQKCSFPIYQTFGMTETISHIAVKLINGVNPTDIYHLLPGWNIKTDNDSRLMVNSSTNSKWIHTNDIVKLVNDRSFQWLGRSDNVINSGGVKIHPEVLESEIQKTLHENSIDRRFFVAGMSDDKLGERMILVLEGPEIEQKMLNIFKKSLPRYTAPKEILWCDQFLETDSGKIRRQATLDRHLNR